MVIKEDAKLEKKIDAKSIGVKDQKKDDKDEEEEEDDDDDLPLSSIYTKILVNYMQLVAIVGSFDFHWPVLMTGYFET